MKTMKNLSRAFSARCCSAFAALALSAPAAAEWSGAGEFGLVFARGNTETETLNTKLTLGYTNERWSNETEVGYLRSESDGDLEADRFVFGNDTRYELSEADYVAGLLRYDRDRFSSFKYQASLAVAYGRTLIDTERQAWSVELGPGVRHSEQRASGETSTNLIARGGMDYRLAISETAELTNETLVESGSNNTFVENETALQVQINDSLALKTGLAIRHNTDVEAGREKTDYLSTVNLVYSFE
jgi:putative salt-induced outer membrane protein